MEPFEFLGPQPSRHLRDRGERTRRQRPEFFHGGFGLVAGPVEDGAGLVDQQSAMRVGFIKKLHEGATDGGAGFPGDRTAG